MVTSSGGSCADSKTNKLDAIKTYLLLHDRNAFMLCPYMWYWFNIFMQMLYYYPLYCTHGDTVTTLHASMFLWLLVLICLRGTSGRAEEGKGGGGGSSHCTLALTSSAEHYSVTSFHHLSGTIPSCWFFNVKCDANENNMILWQCNLFAWNINIVQLKLSVKLFLFYIIHTTEIISLYISWIRQS